MGRYDNLYPRPERIRRVWGIGVVDALNELYGWLTDGAHDINVNSIYAIYGNFASRPYAEGRPVILDGDPITIYQFYDIAKASDNRGDREVKGNSRPRPHKPVRE